MPSLDPPWTFAGPEAGGAGEFAEPVSRLPSVRIKPRRKLPRTDSLQRSISCMSPERTVSQASQAFVTKAPPVHNGLIRQHGKDFHFHPHSRRPGRLLLQSIQGKNQIIVEHTIREGNWAAVSILVTPMFPKTNSQTFYGKVTPRRRQGNSFPSVAVIQVRNALVWLHSQQEATIFFIRCELVNPRHTEMGKSEEILRFLEGLQLSGLRQPARREKAAAYSRGAGGFSCGRWRARRARAQPSLVTWRARPTLSESAGTSLVMQEPAPM